MSGSVDRVASASALAQLVGQLVSFVQTVVLARLLTPTDIGIFAAGTVLTALFTNFVEGGLQAGLVQRQGDLADADETVFWVTLMVGAAASLGCLAAAPVIGIIFNSRTAGLVAAATAGVLLIHSLTNVPESVLQREFSVKRRLIVGPAIAVSYAVGGGRAGRARVGRVVHGRRHVRLLHRLGSLPLDAHILAARPRPCLLRDVARAGAVRLSARPRR